MYCSACFGLCEVDQYDVMKEFDPGCTHYTVHIPAFWSLKGVFPLQWLSHYLTKFFTQYDPNKIIDCIQSQK